MYPINPGDANLNVMARLKALTGLTIGYSDHTEGSKALYYAVAMGARSSSVTLRTHARANSSVIIKYR